MAQQMRNLYVLSVSCCVEGTFGVASGGTPRMKDGAPRDELKNGCGRVWIVPYFGCLRGSLRGSPREPPEPLREAPGMEKIGHRMRLREVSRQPHFGGGA